jgi:hypothetical protein
MGHAAQDALTSDYNDLVVVGDFSGRPDQVL